MTGYQQSFTIKSLDNGLFDPNQIIFFEGKLYERLPRVKGGPRNKYRILLAVDDYDYVFEPRLRKRLDRAFRRNES